MTGPKHIQTDDTFFLVIPYEDEDNPFHLELNGKPAETLRTLINGDRCGVSLLPDLAACVHDLSSEGVQIISRKECPTTRERYARTHYVLLDRVQVFFTRQAMVSVMAGWQ